MCLFLIADPSAHFESFRLVTLQSCIMDNEASQSEVVHKIDGLLEEDATFPLVCGLNSLFDDTDHFNPEAGSI